MWKTDQSFMLTLSQSATVKCLYFLAQLIRFFIILSLSMNFLVLRQHLIPASFNLRFNVRSEILIPFKWTILSISLNDLDRSSKTVLKILRSSLYDVFRLPPPLDLKEVLISTPSFKFLLITVTVCRETPASSAIFDWLIFCSCSNLLIINFTSIDTSRALPIFSIVNYQ